MFFDVTILDDEENDLVQISKEAWRALELEGDEATIAVSPSDGLLGAGTGSTLVCQAAPLAEGKDIQIPRHLLAYYASSLLRSSDEDRIRASIQSVEPFRLDEIVLVALSRSALAFAQEDPDSLRKEISARGRILRQGDVISMAIPPGTANGDSSGRGSTHQLSYLLLMANPVHQGRLDVQSTQVIVAEDEWDAQSSINSSGEGSSEEDAATSDIDESFLLSSLAQPESLSQLGGEAIMGAHSGSFKAIQMPEPPDLGHSHADLSVFVRTADLAKLGVLSGDWVVITNPKDRSKSRICRIFGADWIATLHSASILVSPVLLQNLSLQTEQSQWVQIQQTSFGNQIPPIPTATAITISRIASSVLLQRKYQAPVLQALRKYLQETKRLLKKGDLIPVPVDTSLVTMLDGVSEKESIVLEDILAPLQGAQSSCDEMAFFRVTHIEHNLLQVKPDTAPDAHFAAIMGELGCWVDPENTRLTQSGVENSLVPNFDSFFGIVRKEPSFSLGEQQPMSEASSVYAQLRNILAAALHPKALSYKLAISILVTGVTRVGKRTVINQVARSLGLHVMEVDCYDIVEETEVKTEGVLRARFEQAEEIAPSILLLRNIDSLARKSQKLETGKEPSIVSALQDSISNLELAWSRSGSPTIVVATTRDSDILPISVLACFKHQISIQAPDEKERLTILEALLQGKSIGQDVSLGSIATQTAALVAGDIANLVNLAEIASTERILELRRGISVAHATLAGYSLTRVDFDRALAEARASFSASIGAPTIPKVSWDDVGGLVSVKADILDTIELPLQHPEVFADGMKKRSGVLLFGPPGTGKTLLAKAVATSFSLNFFSVKGPELLNMYIGESEANVRRVFQRARDARPCVIFFDELDSVAPKRGNQGDSGGVMDRIVSQLLAELDGMSDGSGGDVFVIGATNRPDLLDPALLRPGRFDKLLYLGVSDTHEAQLKIIEALTRKFNLDPNLDLGEIAEQCPFNYTGADFYALCSDAMLKAMTRKASEVDEKIAALNVGPKDPLHLYPISAQYYLSEMASQEDTDILVSREDFESALKELTPSVSQSEMEHYRQVQQKFASNPVSTQSLDKPGHGVDRKGKGRAVMVEND